MSHFKKCIAILLCVFSSLGWAQTAKVVTIHKTTGALDGPFGIYGLDISKHQSVATQFTPQKNASLHEIKIWFMNNGFREENLGTVTLSLRSSQKIGEDKYIPSETVIEAWEVKTTARGWYPVEETIVSKLKPLLVANETYWITATSSDEQGVNAIWNISSHTLGWMSNTQRDGQWEPIGEEQKTQSPTLIITGLRG